MIDSILFYVHHTLTLLWGVILTAAFSGVRLTRKNALILGGIFAACGISMLATLLLLGEKRVWELYPLIVHALLGVLLGLVFHKRPVTVLASVSLAYLCCQPSKWCGMLVETFVSSQTPVWCVKILVALVMVMVTLRFLVGYISELFNKDTRGVLIFCSVPVVYYLFDYTVGVYTGLWTDYIRLMAEFLAFFLCIAFMAFCVIYYREYEQKMQIQRKNQIIELTVNQQAKEIEAIREKELETRLLRHDMRHLLSNLAMTIEQNDRETALKLISGYAQQVEATSLRRYCKNDTVNYILANFEERCHKAHTDFQVDLSMDSLPVDEIMFSSIMANALDNALNAQAAVEAEKRQIRLMLKESDGKLLLSVKNPYAEPLTRDPVTQIPVATAEGHGYGVQSILYLTEKMGGKYQFTIQDGWFTLRVVL